MCDLRPLGLLLPGRSGGRWGPNELLRLHGRTWPREPARQLSRRLALLLWLAATLSFAVGSYTVAIAVLLVILSSAPFASMPPVDE